MNGFMEAIYDTYVLLLIILETKSYNDIKSRFSKSRFDFEGDADMFIGREAELSSKMGRWMGKPLFVIRTLKVD